MAEQLNTGPERARQLYMLKHLSNRWAWVGNRVHDAIKSVLQKTINGYQIELEEVAEEMVRRMRQEFRSSERGHYRSQNKAFGLREHEYQEDISREQWRKVTRRVPDQLLTLPDSITYQDIISAIERPIGEEDWLEVEDRSQISIDGVRVWVQPDVAWLDRVGHLHVADWKTGRMKPEDAEQMQAYAAYGVVQWRVTPEEVVTHRVYLNAASVTLGNVTEPTERMSEEDVDDFLAMARSSIRAMRATLVDEDLQRNQPLPEDQFPMTTDLDTCRTCEYRRDCGR